jgi:hypothetical protein
MGPEADLWAIAVSPGESIQRQRIAAGRGVVGFGPSRIVTTRQT